MDEQFLRIGGTDGSKAKALRTDTKGNVMIRKEWESINVVNETQLTAGSFINSQVIDANNYDFIVLFIKANTNAEISVRLDQSPNNTFNGKMGDYYSEVLADSEPTSLGTLLVVVPVKCRRNRFRITNKSDFPVSLSAAITFRTGVL